MKQKNLLVLGAAAVVLLGAGVWLSAHRAQQGNLGGGAVFPDLKAALGEVGEVRLSKGDGSRTTLRKGAGGWTVVERNYPADGNRVRELVMNLVAMKVIERKTSDPANYAKLGVEKPDSPTASSTLLEVVAGKKTWSLIVGKGAEGRAIYVRKPDDAASALAEPAVTADPDQKRWLDRAIIDLPGADVHDISVKPAAGPAYLLTRARRGDADLALSPIPKGRTAASAMSIDGQAEALVALNFDDVRVLPAAPPAATDRATYRTFDGQVFEFSGHRDPQKAYVSVSASHDAALAAEFAAPAPAAVPAADSAKPAEPAKPAAQPAVDVERLAARAKGVEYEIPIYKYESIFKPQEELLEKNAAPAAAKKTLPTKK
ncbi:MAG: DUF4340 domain-containing protein [Pseudomonadota bacterium]